MILKDEQHLSSERTGSAPAGRGNCPKSDTENLEPGGAVGILKCRNGKRGRNVRKS